MQQRPSPHPQLLRGPEDRLGWAKVDPSLPHAELPLVSHTMVMVTLLTPFH
jgi:hypothetical protein